MRLARIPEAVVMGASAGGVEAYVSIFAALPETFRLPIIIVNHIPSERRSLLPEVFGARSLLQVKEVEDKEPILPGIVYTAPADYHVLVEPDRTLSLSADAPVLFSRPSIDVLFESAADAYAERLLGILMTGANSDGARGLQRIHQAGGMTIIQDPSEAQSPAMPEAAARLFQPDQVLPLVAIAKLLASLAQEA